MTRTGFSPAVAEQSRPNIRALYALPDLSKPVRSWDFQYGSVEAPSIGPGQVLIRVVAAALRRQDFSDVVYHRYHADEKRRAFVYIPGVDISGIVLSTAQDVASIKAGDPVVALLDRRMDGGCSELVAVDKERVWAKPPQLCFAEAAAINMDGLCALQAFERAGKHMPMHEPNILVTGAASGIGVLITQVAKELYSAKVTALYKDDSQLDILEKLDLHKAVRFSEDNSSSSYTLSPAQFDVVFDTRGIAYKVAKYVKGGGLVLSTDGFPPRETIAGLKFRGQLKHQTKRHQERDAKACHEAGATHEYIFPCYNETKMQALLELRRKGVASPPYGPVFGLAKWGAGINAAKEQVKGKIIIAMDERKSVYATL